MSAKQELEVRQLLDPAVFSVGRLLKIKSYLEKSYYVSLKREKFKILEKNKVSFSIKFDGQGRVPR